MDKGTRVKLVKKDPYIKAESVKVGDLGVTLSLPMQSPPSRTFVRVKYDSAPHLSLVTGVEYLEEVAQ